MSKLTYSMIRKRRGENDIDEYYIDDEDSGNSVAIVHGRGSIGNEANAKELVRRWNAFEEGGIVDELRKACELGMIGISEASVKFERRFRHKGQAMLKKTLRILEAALAKS